MNKQQALDLYEQKRKEVLDYSRWVAKKIYKEKGHVTIDDVRVYVSLPDGVDGRVFGAVFNKEEWEKTGYTNTTRQSSHGRPIAVFKLIEASAPTSHNNSRQEQHSNHLFGAEALRPQQYSLFSVNPGPTS